MRSIDVRGHREIVQLNNAKSFTTYTSCTTSSDRDWLELVTVFGTVFRGEHIVGLAQPMSLRLSSSVRYKTSAGIAESMTIETQVLKACPTVSLLSLSDSPSSA